MTNHLLIVDDSLLHWTLNGEIFSLRIWQLHTNSMDQTAVILEIMSGFQPECLFWRWSCHWSVNAVSRQFSGSHLNLMSAWFFHAPPLTFLIVMMAISPYCMKFL